MSDDELWVLILSCWVAARTWWRWYAGPLLVRRLTAREPGLIVLTATPFVAGAFLLYVLLHWSSQDVQNDWTYILFYLALGAAWIGATTLGLAFLGIGERDDVVERGNRAAVPLSIGGLIALTFCYAGANIGNGPGWWVVLFSAALASAALALAWIAIDTWSGADDVVSIDRDWAAGIRLGAFLAAAGAVLGRAVAGDWVSASATVSDFARTGWPVIALALLVTLWNRAATPTVERPAPSPLLHGVLPALVFLGIAAIYVIRLGLPG